MNNEDLLRKMEGANDDEAMAILKFAVETEQDDTSDEMSEENLDQVVGGVTVVRSVESAYQVIRQRQRFGIPMTKSVTEIMRDVILKGVATI